MLNDLQLSKLKIMLIDESLERRQSLVDLLRNEECEVIACLQQDQDLIQQVEHYQPDMIIIDIELPGRDMLEHLRFTQSVIPKPMVMFSQDEDGQTIRRAIQSGVSAYVVNDIQSSRVRPLLEAAIATFEQHQQLHSALKETQTELNNRKQVDRAKGILMKQHGLDEPAAYQFLRKRAMDTKQRIPDIAQQVIDAAELLSIR